MAVTGSQSSAARRPAEPGRTEEVGFTLTQAAINNSNVAPIPMLWRTDREGGCGWELQKHLWVRLSSDLWEGVKEE